VRASFVEYYHNDCWVAYLEAKADYHKFAGCCTFSVYAALRIVECLENTRKRFNSRVLLESRYSFDRKFNDKYAESQRFFAVKGDFTNLVSLRDFINRQSHNECFITWELYHGYTQQEIMAKGQYTIDEYQHYKSNIKRNFEDWQQMF